MANMEHPRAELSPVIHGRNPAFRRGVLGFYDIVLETLDFENKGNVRGEAHEIIRLVVVIDALILVGDK
jgi:hypothetical protein